MKRTVKSTSPFTAWGIRGTTAKIMGRTAMHHLQYLVKVPFIFYSRRDARKWLKDYTDGSVGVPIKIWIQECKEGL